MSAAAFSFLPAQGGRGAVYGFSDEGLTAQVEEEMNTFYRNLSQNLGVDESSLREFIATACHQKVELNRSIQQRQELAVRSASLERLIRGQGNVQISPLDAQIKRLEKQIANLKLPDLKKAMETAQQKQDAAAALFYADHNKRDQVGRNTKTKMNGRALQLQQNKSRTETAFKEAENKYNGAAAEVERLTFLLDSLNRQKQTNTVGFEGDKKGLQAEIRAKDEEIAEKQLRFETTFSDFVRQQNLNDTDAGKIRDSLDRVIQ